MPTYDYQCKKCGTFEAFHSMTAAGLKKCPTCKGKVTRLIGSGSAVLFKGKGFYQTDYRSKSYSESAKKDTPTSSAPSSPPASTAAPATPKTNPPKSKS